MAQRRPLDESRTYSSLNASYNGPFGYGWSSHYDMHLNLGTGSPPSSIDVVQDDGAYVSFAWNGSQYVAPPRVLATLAQNGDGAFTVTRRHDEQFVFTSTGQLSKEIGRIGWAGSPGPSVAAAYTTTLAYSSGRLSTVTDAAGRTLTFSYGTNGKVSAVADSAGRGLLYGDDGAGNLTDVTDVGGGNTHFTYDANHFLQTVRDPRGNTVETNTYDAYGRVTDQKDGLLRDTTIDYRGRRRRSIWTWRLLRDRRRVLRARYARLGSGQSPVTQGAAERVWTSSLPKSGHLRTSNDC